MPPNGIATELIHVGQAVTAHGPGYYRRSQDGDPIAGYATHCATLGEPLEITNENH